MKRVLSPLKTACAKLAAVVRSPTFRSIAGTFLGGVAIAAGAGLVYPPAGLILGGAELVAYCLILIDVDRKER